MVGKLDLILQRAARIAMAAIVALTVLLPQTTITATAGEGDRTLYLYYTHTKETGRFTFKKNGQYDKKVLGQLNYFLRDWRRNEPATMDPRLFDLIWTVYQKVGGTQPINIVSAYRSPATNAMLRAKSSGVAENSQHMKGHAMDFFIPGVSLVKLRQVAMQQQVGGVGFYPTSGSPFVHLDVGSVRAWPRMTRAQLKEIFPDGRTLHVPTDGKPLSNEGRQFAQAQWQKCRMVPCGGSGSTKSGGKTIFDMFSGGNQEAPAMAVADAGPASRTVAAVQVVAPVPMARPAELGAAPQVQMASLDQAVAIPFSTRGSAPLTDAEIATGPLAPLPATKSPRLMMATAPANANNNAVMAIAAIEAPVPAPRMLLTKTPDIVTAYVPQQPDAEAQRALDLLIAREATASLPLPAKPVISADAIHTASLAPAAGLDAFKGIFDSVAKPAVQALATPPAPMPSIALRDVSLVAPDIDHVDETLVATALISSGHFAVLFDHDEADFDPATELGTLTGAMAFSQSVAPLAADRFSRVGPLLVASR